MFNEIRNGNLAIGKKIKQLTKFEHLTVTIQLPILYSFRRCPYAMRSRLSIVVAGKKVAIREVILRNKPKEMLLASPKGTVPVLVLPNNQVIDESLDIMLWALDKIENKKFLEPEKGSFNEIMAMISSNDNEFKYHLDRYKYANRYENANPEHHRNQAAVILKTYEERLRNQRYLFGDDESLADIAIAPFVRQFAHTDFEWFNNQNWLRLSMWLEKFKASEKFRAIMVKYPAWDNQVAPGTQFYI